MRNDPPANPAGDDFGRDERAPGSSEPDAMDGVMFCTPAIMT
jgi:hypothetical protein